MIPASTDSGATPRGRWRLLAWLVPLIVVIAVVGVLFARFLRDQPALMSFLADYPGQSALPQSAPVGIPAWLAWQHGLNAFFLLFVVRSGLQLRRRQRPAAFFLRNNTGPFTTKDPPRRIGIELWLHLVVDTLFIVNGIVYVVLLFATGQWVRLVPTRWDIVPNAFSAALQYASLDWPTENGWVNYNALQVLSYFAVVFLLAPAAIATGIRMSPAFVRRDIRWFPLAPATRVHWWILVAFLAFTAVHVFLVLATGALRNLNHIYTATDSSSPAGLIVFVATIVVMVVAVVLLKPPVLKVLASTMGTVK